MPTAAYSIVVAITLGIVFACALLHYETFIGFQRLLGKLRVPMRRRILFIVFGPLVVHIIEIWIFAGGYYLLGYAAEAGALDGARTFLRPRVFFRGRLHHPWLRRDGADGRPPLPGGCGVPGGSRVDHRVRLVHFHQNAEILALGSGSIGGSRP